MREFVSMLPCFFTFLGLSSLFAMFPRFLDVDLCSDKCQSYHEYDKKKDRNPTAHVGSSHSAASRRIFDASSADVSMLSLTYGMMLRTLTYGLRTLACRPPNPYFCLRNALRWSWAST